MARVQGRTRVEAHLVDGQGVVGLERDEGKEVEPRVEANAPSTLDTVHYRHVTRVGLG